MTNWDKLDAVRDSLTIVLGTVLIFGLSAVLGIWNPAWSFASFFPAFGPAISLVVDVFIAVVFAMILHHYEVHAFAADLLSIFAALVITDIFAVAFVLDMGFIILLLMQVFWGAVVVGGTFWASRRIKG